MQRSVVSIGNFDGVHRGHRAILAKARELAAEQAALGQSAVPVVAITFDPHPAVVLRPGRQPPRLLSRQDKVTRLEAAGADRVIVLEPTPELLGQSPESFIQAVIERHRPIAVVEGEDFRFGKGRAGDVDLLADLGRRLGFQTVVVPKAQVTLTDKLATAASSSLIRWLIGHGRVLDAAYVLGRPFTLTGEIVRGERQGRTLGIPTVNLDPAAYADFIIPADGVYAGYGTVDMPSAAAQPWLAAISVGRKPALGGGHPLTIEAHLLDYTPPTNDHDALYGRTITLSFDRWLRDQQPFPSLDDLRAQMARDLELTRRWHDGRILQPCAA